MFAADGRTAAAAIATSSPERVGWVNNPAGLNPLGSPSGAVQRTGSRSVRNCSAHCWGLAAVVDTSKVVARRHPFWSGRKLAETPQRPGSNKVTHSSPGGLNEAYVSTIRR